MVRHIIVWKMNEEYSEEKKAEIKAAAKKELEGLLGRIPGLLTMTIHTEGLVSSNGDLMLEASFESEKALNNYTVHPEHMKVATTYVRPFMKTRLCFDFEA